MGFDFSLNFKIFDKNGKILCHVNMNHTLPLAWNMPNETVNDERENVLFALRLVEILEERYKKDELVQK